MPKIKIMRMICPSAHVILGAAYDAEKQTDDEAIKFINVHAARLQIDPWCMMCKSRELKFAADERIFRSAEEATPFIYAEICEQVKIRHDFIAAHRRAAAQN